MFLGLKREKEGIDSTVLHDMAYKSLLHMLIGWFSYSESVHYSDTSALNN